MAEAKTDEHEAPQRWIDDSFEGVVYVHAGEGESLVLQAGDEIPTEYDDRIKSHIPTTRVEPRSAKIRKLDADGPRTEQVHGAPFDPRAHNIDDVNAYIQAHPEDVQRVLEVERSGRARRGILKRD